MAKPTNTASRYRPTSPTELILASQYWTYRQRDYDADDNVIYQGFNIDPDAADSDDTWLLLAYVYDANFNNLTERMKWGAWAERYTLFASFEWDVDTVTTNTGTLIQGTEERLHEVDSDPYSVREVGGAPGFDIEFEWTGVSSFDRIEAYLDYDGSSSHTVQVQLYNTNTTVWDAVHTISTFNEYHLINEEITDTDYIDAGVVQARIYHVTAGNASHYIYIDHIALIQD